MSTRIVSVLLFEDVEVLDFAGPFEVFNVAGLLSGMRCFDVYTTAQRLRPVLARGKLSINPEYAYDEQPEPHILVVPGGPGSRRECVNPATLEHIRRHHARGGIILSVCTGALIITSAGLADGKAIVTHQVGLPLLETMGKDLRIHPKARVVDNGSIVFSAGVSAGTDAALYLVARLYGKDVAVKTAQYMEYDWRYTDVDGISVIDARAE